ncbi:hypothetical protein [Brumimicrobium aurantiacum]|uniref:Uncharacterized protein n=1 Tax=Brumimicrobium aurantiacum TaxID=1737063 RepID=A0A3E1F047_9FLAO|nr:hypothetical protein [Brumimicrobium aurantiacum]RFC55180.1 hypothetical protein DXU93_04995 [Brumimicrobium aurantiacum]
MGRPPTRPAKLKDGFYIEVRNEGSKANGIKIRRDTKEEMEMAIEDYNRIKDVTVLGELKNDKWVNKKEAKAAKKK